MPPLEAFKALITAFVGHSHDGDPNELAFYDNSRAHFYGVATRRLWVELRDEEKICDKEPM
eukprot:13480373-Heterocapsa_arctica.AAC.1